MTDQAVRRLMRLQGTMRPDQIISLLDLGANTLAMADHNDHIHVGFRPRFGANRKARPSRPRPCSSPASGPTLLKRLRRDREPGGADQAVEVRAAGQEAEATSALD